MTTALGVAQTSDGTGLDPLTHRRLIQALWQNTGVVGGLAVSGRSDLSYQVGAGAAILSRSNADGYTEAFFAGGTTAAVRAGDGSNPRVDTVYIVAHDVTQGDSDNQVTVGVVSGTAAASPQAPDLSHVPGALPLANMLMPARASSTQSASRSATVGYAVPYGCGLGLVARHVHPMDSVGDSRREVVYDEQRVSFMLPTRRAVRLVFQACISTATENDNNARGGWYMTFCVDGQPVPNGGCEFDLTRTYKGCYWEVTTTLDAGAHTAFIRSHNQWGQAPKFHWSANGADQYIGRVFSIYDEGVPSPVSPLYQVSTDGSKFRV